MQRCASLPRGAFWLDPAFRCATVRLHMEAAPKRHCTSRGTTGAGAPGDSSEVVDIDTETDDDEEDVVIATLAVRPEAEATSSQDADEVACCGERTRAERDAELLSKAVDLDEPPATQLEAQLTVAKVEEPQKDVGAVAEPKVSEPPAASVKKEAKKDVELNTEQQRALNLALAGENVFLTGGAGTGKSLTLNRIIAALKEKWGVEAVQVTASTGIAATVIGGTTLHSFAGIGMGQGTADELVSKLNRHAAERWRRTAVLVIDEVSMLDGGLFEKLDAVGGIVLRAPTQCFGGIQLILSGDFFQLPPVGLQRDRLKFLFEASCWDRAAQHTVLLREIFRQTDSTFISLLNEMRRARLSEFSMALLRHSVASPPQLSLPTKLFPHNAVAEEHNLNELTALPGRTRKFLATDDGKMKWLLKDLLVPAALVLKEGAHVMLLKNLDQHARLVNGSRGVVVGFEVDQSDHRAYIAHHLVESGQSTKEEAFADVQQYPVVEFDVGDGRRERRLITPQLWRLEQGGAPVAQRHQVPLKLAWAISVHKAQGMTLQACELDLARCFDDGMAYVALSRAVSLQACRIVSFDPRKVTANPKVVAFYGAIEAANPPAVPANGGGSSQGGDSSSQGGGCSSQGGGSGLTAEQRERMARKRAEAARKLAERTANSANAPAAPLSRFPPPGQVQVLR